MGQVGRKLKPVRVHGPIKAETIKNLFKLGFYPIFSTRPVSN